MNQQAFVTRVIETAGGIVEPLEYALCQVIVPQECAALLGGRTERLLAFNYDVAIENPEAEFVTFGSSLLEDIQEYVQKQAVVWVGSVIVDHPEVTDAQGKIETYLAQQLDLRRCKVMLSEPEHRYGLYIYSEYRCKFLTDEPFTEDYGAWIDMTARELCREMQDQVIFFEEGIPRDRRVVMTDAGPLMELARAECFRKAKHTLAQLGGSEILAKETSRIAKYYEELDAENTKRMSRKGITEQHLQEIISKGEAIRQEGVRQLAEITEKYHYNFDAQLARTSVYFVPIARYHVKITGNRNGGEKEMEVFYNPILRKFKRCKV